MLFNKWCFFLRHLTTLLGAGGILPWMATGKPKNKPSITQHTVPLWPDGSPNNHLHEKYGRPRLEVYVPENPGKKKRPALVILPGGGYYQLTPHEGIPVAEFLARKGFIAAVLTYHISPHTHPLPLADAARAVRLMRAQAAFLNLNKNKIGLIGFSAGGHLAATLATQPDLYLCPDDDLAGKFSARPNGLLLAYPVISFQPNYGHLGSAEGLLGSNPRKTLLNQLSNELHVTPQNPPVFLFHTADDPIVDVENSLHFAAACSKQKVPVAIHIYPEGSHGVGLAQNNQALKSWTGLLIDWLVDWNKKD